MNSQVINEMTEETSSESNNEIPVGFLKQELKEEAASIQDIFMKSESQIFGSKAENKHHHAQMHSQEAKPYKCTYCGKGFANSSYLSQHTRIHLGIKPYKCEVCDRKFTQLSHLQQHVRTHTGDKPYKCQYPACNKAFSQLSNLQSHFRCHQTDKPYKCNACYKCFSDEQSLQEHIPKHKESKHLKTHICQHCGKSYTQDKYLIKHVKKHLKQRDRSPPIMGIPPNNQNISMICGSGGSVNIGNPYWMSSTSSETSTSLTEAMVQQQACLQKPGNGIHEEQNLANIVQNKNLSECRSHHSDNGSSSSDNGEDLAISARKQNHEQIHQHQQSAMSHDQPPTATPQDGVSSSPSSAYDESSMSAGVNNSSDNKTLPGPLSASTFLPIQAMGSLAQAHDNLNHHQFSMNAVSARLPYMPYDPIYFQRSNVITSPGSQIPSLGSRSTEIPRTNSNAFPNHLISLHQIKNYAHQPSVSSFMSGDYVFGLKKKGQ